jgi:cytochrome c-type biogenesis protein CcmF
MHLLGHGLLVAAFVLGVLGGVSALVGVRTDDERLALLSRRCVYAWWACIFAASMLLWHFILSNDFSNEYVYSVSDTKMPWYYQAASFWGGQKGSLLFWTFQLANFSALAVFLNGDRNRPIIPYTIATLCAIFLFFDSVLLFATDPFEQFLVLGALPEGRGLNPLLQNPSMTYHPPTMLSAYAVWAVPFAFAVGALVSGKLDDVWIRSVRRWAIFGWFLLSMGNLFGCFWSYEELGWGGYWAWDPVENASFMPWLTATAYLHSVMIQERRGILKVWNIILVQLTFILTIFGTAITRTGLIQSVHAFASGGSIKFFFFTFLIVIIVGSVALVVWRLRLLRSEGYIDSWLSREAAFVLNNVLFVTGTLVVLWGTMFPKISEVLVGRETSIGPPWFNQFMAPIGILLLALSGIGPLISWRRASADNLTRNILAPVVWGVALTALVVGTLQNMHWFHTADVSISLSPLSISMGAVAIVALYFSNFVLAAVWSELFKAARARRRSTGERFGEALLNVVGRSRRRYGGYVVHAGIALLFFGFAGTAFKEERDVRMNLGETATVGDYTMRFDRLSSVESPEKSTLTAHMFVRRNGKKLGDMEPARFLFKNPEKTNTTEVDTRGGLSEDFYIALVNIGPGGKSVSLKVIINPLVLWMYPGAFFILLGAIIAMLPAGVLETRRRRMTPAPPPGRRAAIAATVLLVILGPAAVVAWAAPQVSARPPPEALDLWSKIRCDCGGCGDVPIDMCQPTCGRGEVLRNEILAKLASGMTPQQIMTEQINLRGPRALAYPMEGGINFLHWLVPALSAVGALAVGAIVVRRLTKGAGQVVAVGATGLDAPSDHELDAYADRVASELDRLE